MNTAWNRWCRNLPSSTAFLLYENRITPIIITDITGRRNVRIQNPYTCTTSSGSLVLLDDVQHALLKGRSTQRVWHCACAYALLSREQVESAPKKKKNALRVWVYLGSRLGPWVRREATRSVGTRLRFVICGLMADNFNSSTLSPTTVGTFINGRDVYMYLWHSGYFSGSP